MDFAGKDINLYPGGETTYTLYGGLLYNWLSCNVLVARFGFWSPYLCALAVSFF